MSHMCVSTVVILESVNPELCYRPAPISLTFIPTHVIAFCQMPRAICVLTSCHSVADLSAVMVVVVVVVVVVLIVVVASTVGVVLSALILDPILDFYIFACHLLPLECVLHLPVFCVKLVRRCFRALILPYPLRLTFVPTRSISSLAFVVVENIASIAQ